jgi:hypothetical protein
VHQLEGLVDAVAGELAVALLAWGEGGCLPSKTC